MHLVERMYMIIEQKKVCEYCGGEGIIVEDAYEPIRGHKQVEQKCICQIEQ